VKANSFRIRRTTGTSNSLRNDNSRKGTPIEKENMLKTANSKRPSALANSLQKLTGIYSASYSKSDKITESSETETVKDKLTKAPYKYITSVNSEGIDGTERVFGEQNAEFVYERRQKSSTMTDIEKNVAGIRGNSHPRGLAKKSTVTMAQQAKASLTGNFLTPKLFELNIHGAKNDASKANTIGSMVYGPKGLGKAGKTLQIAKDMMNQANYSSEAQANMQKYFGINIENKK